MEDVTVQVTESERKITVVSERESRVVEVFVEEPTPTKVEMSINTSTIGLPGIQGPKGDSITTEYSVDGATLWHSVWVSGDLYVRVQLGTDGWSNAIRFVGIDGLEVEMQNSGTYIQWRYTGGSWINLVSLSSLTGANGIDGVGISSIALTSTSGLANTYTITYTDATTSTYTVTNGADGTDGTDGADGADGSGVTILGSDTVTNILAITTGTTGDMWIATSTGTDDDGNPVAVGDGVVFDGTKWLTVGPIRGPIGISGTTYWTWIKYSDVADGTGLYDIPTANTKYIGIAVNQTSDTESADKLDYVWSKIKGEDGADGININPLIYSDFKGATLPSGISQLNITPSSSDSGTTTTLTSTSTDPIVIMNVSASPLDCYLFTGRVKFISGVWDGTVSYTNTNHGVSTSYYGRIPQPEVGVWTDIKLDFRNIATASDFMTGGNIASIRFDFSWSNSAVMVVDWLSVGKYGLVEDGTDGSNATTSTVVTLYKRSATTPFRPSVNSHYTFSTGILIDHNNGWTQTIPATDGNPLWSIQAIATATAPSDTDTIVSTEWTTQSKILEDGADGADGDNGVVVLSATDVATYGSLDDPALYQSYKTTIIDTNATALYSVPAYCFIFTYKGSSAARLSQYYYEKYTGNGFFRGFDGISTWSAWTALKGTNGINGTNGTNGANGVNAYVHIRWGTTATPATLLTTPNSYIGIASTSSATAPTSYTGYSWYLYKGATGATGATGSTGATGATGPTKLTAFAEMSNTNSCLDYGTTIDVYNYCNDQNGTLYIVDFYDGSDSYSSSCTQASNSLNVDVTENKITAINNTTVKVSIDIVLNNLIEIFDENPYLMIGIIDKNDTIIAKTTTKVPIVYGIPTTIHSNSIINITKDNEYRVFISGDWKSNVGGSSLNQFQMYTARVTFSEILHNCTQIT